MEIGKTLTVEQLVTQRESAAHYGSGLLQVYATPSMVALMENAAHQLAKLFLTETEDTVGIEINIKHTKATPVGDKVSAQATLTAVDGKKLFFTVRAFDSKGDIGSGTHIRYIINPKEFMEKIS